MRMGAASFCMAGTALGAPQARLAWQAKHLEHLTLVLRGRRSTSSTFIEVGGSLATSDANGRRLVLRGRRSTWSTFIEVVLRRLVLRRQEVRRLVMRPQRPRFPWQAQHLEHLRLVFRGTRSTCSTFIELRGSLGTSDANGRRLVLRGRRSAWSTSGSVCVAGAALGAPPARFAWQAQHFEHLHRGRWKSGDEWCEWAPPRFAWQAQHLGHLRLVLHGRRSTCSISIELVFRLATSACDLEHLRLVLCGRCSTWKHLRLRIVFAELSIIHTTPSTLSVAGANTCTINTHIIYRYRCINTTSSTQPHQHITHLHNTILHNTIYTTPSTRHSSTHTSSTQYHLHYIIKSKHHQHNIINTTSSTQPHQHITIYTTPPTQYHLHNTINPKPSTLHHQTQHHTTHTSFTLHHQHSIINTTSSTHHHLHNTIYTHIIYTTSPTQHYQHNLINTSPSTQHHLHNTINTTPSTLHHQTLAGAALGALPYYPFCLIPADTPLVILRCGLFFILFHWPIPQLDVWRQC